MNDIDKTTLRSMARAAPRRAIRDDGEPYAADRVLTMAQQNFARELIRGLAPLAAYKLAYPNNEGSDRIQQGSAYKLQKDKRIARMVYAAQIETIEHLAEDVAAVRRYVLKELLEHSKAAKQETTKIAALKLMGQAAGMFSDRPATVQVQVTAEQLKAELAGHLRFLDDKPPPLAERIS
jgi:hypothetical protein